MDKYIIELIDTNDTVIIPKFGALMKAVSGKGVIVFNEHLKFNDGLIVNHVAEKESIDKDEATKKTEEYALGIISQIEKGESYSIEGFGAFSKDKNGEIQFTQGSSPAATPPKKPKPAKKEEPKAVEKPVKEPKVEKKAAAKKADLKKEEPLKKETTKKKESLADTLAKGEKETKKKEAPKKEVAKKEEPKKEAAKKEEPKKVAAKKEEPKKEAAKKEEPKKEAAKKEEPKKEAAKKEEPKKEAAKKEEPKKEAVKKEETKKGKSKEKVEKAAAVAATDPMAHVAPQDEQVELPAPTVTKPKKKKKRFALLILLLAIIGGGTFVALNLDQVKGWFDSGESSAKEASAENSDEADSNDESENSDDVEVDDPIIDEEPIDSAETEVIDETFETETTEAIEEPEVEPEPTPEVEPEPTPAVTTNSSGGYHIIANAFSSESNADNYVRSLQDMGLSGASKLGRINGLYQVAAGSYSSMADAKAALSSMRSKTGTAAWIMSR